MTVGRPCGRPSPHCGAKPSRPGCWGPVLPSRSRAQAIFLGAAVAAGVDGRGWSAAAPAAWAFLAAVAVRSGLTWIAEVRGRRAAGAAMADLRARLVATTLAAGGADRGGRRAGELAALATQGGAAVERWAGRVLPQAALAALVPVAALAVIVARDPLSAALLAPTLPLLIVFLVLAGGDAKRVADHRFAAMSLLGAHLLDVTRGLPVLRSLGRAEVQREQLAVAGDAYRRATIGTLRSAFVSSFALEFVAMLGTALVAVVAGVRLVNGTMAFEDALVVLLLAPEIYGPLRRAGVEYHAAADARATLRRLLEVDWREPADRVGGARRCRRGPASGGDRVRAGHGERGGGRAPAAGATCRSRSRPGRPPRSSGRAARASRPCCASCSDCSRSGADRCAAAGSSSPRWISTRGVRASRGCRSGRCCCRRRSPRTCASPTRRPATSNCGRRSTAAGLEPWAAGLPGGLAARLGEGGVAASAGERRRLALARIALRDPALVLVDEPTANLDAVTAALVCDALERIVARPYRRARHPRPRRRGARGPDRRAGGGAAGGGGARHDRGRHAPRMVVGLRPARTGGARPRRRARDRRGAGDAGAAGSVRVPARPRRRAARDPHARGGDRRRPLLRLAARGRPLRRAPRGTRPRARPPRPRARGGVRGADPACAGPARRADLG